MKPALLFTLTACLAACALPPPTLEQSRLASPAGFIPEAARENAAQRALAEIALHRSVNADVRRFANGVVAETDAEASRLQGLAKPWGLSATATLSPVDQGDIQDLKGIAPDRLDMEYADIASRHGQQAVRLYTLAARDSASPQIVAYAKTGEPLMVRRYEAAYSLFNLVRTDFYAIFFDSK
jgi:putative membrane protein